MQNSFVTLTRSLGSTFRTSFFQTTKILLATGTCAVALGIFAKMGNLPTYFLCSLGGYSLGRGVFPFPNMVSPYVFGFHLFNVCRTEKVAYSVASLFVTFATALPLIARNAERAERELKNKPEATFKKIAHSVGAYCSVINFLGLGLISIPKIERILLQHISFIPLFQRLPITNRHATIIILATLVTTSTVSIITHPVTKLGYPSRLASAIAAIILVCSPFLYHQE